jgi:hypothetical protein
MAEIDKITVTKLDAGRRQLETAITLWFNGDDPVSIHTLACAAYEIIHVVSQAKNRWRHDLLFDTLTIKDEYRGEWNKRIKQPANFFKHARNDPDGSLDFDPAISEAFIMFSLAGLRDLVQQLSRTEAVYIWWLHFHRPDLLTEEGREKFSKMFTAQQIADARSLSKPLFFEVFVENGFDRADVIARGRIHHA